MDLFKGSMARRPSNNNPELTLSYLCDKDTKGVGCQGTTRARVAYDSADHEVRKDNDGDGSDSGVGLGVGVGDDCVEMDFMNLNEGGRDTGRWDRSSKRAVASADGVDADFKEGGDGREKRSKIEALNLSLALPEVSLPLLHGNGTVDASAGVRALAPESSTRTTTTYSNDLTAVSYSYSYSYSHSHSHQFSHNPSCSLKCNTTEKNYEYSIGNKGRDDQIWYAGEGTNGSVHSRFKPLGDGGGVSLADGGGVSLADGGRGNSSNIAMQGIRQISRDYSERDSYMPSELPARLTRAAVSGDSRIKNCENSLAGNGVLRFSRPERLVREIVSESIPVMSQIVQELSEEVLESTKEYLRSLLDVSQRTEELNALQIKLDQRSDLTKETLSKCNKDQLQIMVALRTGLGSYLSGKSKIPSIELVEIFLFLRCRNVNCKMLLPVDDCECKVCSTNRGFCSSCMCPVCLKFDCASNTCSWVGCDLCSHWCHTSCGIQRNLIRRPALTAKSGTAGMHFFCMSCDHASELYGFVKDVFSCFARGWSEGSLMKELDCVRKIFMRSEDLKEKELHKTANRLVSGLGTKTISPSDACDTITKFFNGAADSLTFFSARCESTDVTPVVQPSCTRPPVLPRESPIKGCLLKDDDDGLVTLMKKQGFCSLESAIRLKEAESRMFQSKSDEARREAGEFQDMILSKMEKVEEEYSLKLSSLCVKDAEELRVKKLAELKLLEDSHCDYHKMKVRMQSEIGGLLQRMEATKRQWM